VKETEEGANEVMALLEKYCNASRHRVNLDKSSAFFSKGCLEAKRQLVKGILNVLNETLRMRSTCECPRMWASQKKWGFQIPQG
jgi:hypothetical protein